MKCSTCKREIDGVNVFPAYDADVCRLCDLFEQGTNPGGHGTQWPQVSDAMGVHPLQIAEAVADARKKGVPTDFDKVGRPILRDRQHRAAYHKAYNVHDKHAGYGDYAGPSRRSEAQCIAEESRRRADYG